jgi:hypothetical protein
VYVACRERMRNVHKIFAVKPKDITRIEPDTDGTLMEVK